jgi:cardiolipin synthase
MTWFEILVLIAVAVPIAHLVGLFSAIHAVLYSRTAQGATGWAIGLIGFPWVAIPLYWVFGRSRFEGYVQARRADRSDFHVNRNIEVPTAVNVTAACHFEDADVDALERLAQLPFTRSNRIDLLMNGEETFDAIFDALTLAKDYVLVQFYIVRDDNTGGQLKDALIACALRGVRVYFMYDNIGSQGLSRRYLRDLNEAGVQTTAFRSSLGRNRRFQINFRNHRKIVVVDGRIGFLGGLNVGDEYRGNDPQIGAWRDTHARIEGPAALAVQLSFAEDWRWATEHIPEWNWEPTETTDCDVPVLILPTGPADDLETCGLAYQHAVNIARQRIWIASPYFVPDEAIMNSLQLAALRGVDVRIMLPKNSDSELVRLAMITYFDECERTGVKLYQYEEGFLHQKVLLVDDQIAAVGTANMDNRSFRLNFEITAIAIDRGFAQRMETMLLQDFEKCSRVESGCFARLRPTRRLAARIARLMAPIL